MGATCHDGNRKEQGLREEVAKTVEEACKLAETGFDHFTTMDGVQIFRKRK